MFLRKFNLISCLILFSLFFLFKLNLGAAEGFQFSLPKIFWGVKAASQPKDFTFSLQVLFLIAILALAPSIILMTTAFTRVVVILDFIKRSLSLQQMPPHQVIVGLALFLTFFIMAPVFKEINTTAWQPYLKGKINQEVFLEKGIQPLRKFMFKQTREKDIALFIKLAKEKRPKVQAEVPTYCLIPAFMISELRRAFEIGIYIFLPFLVIDMIVASILMAMGMVMLPPAMIAFPFKIILFILVDGWNLLIYELVKSFG